MQPSSGIKPVTKTPRALPGLRGFLLALPSEPNNCATMVYLVNQPRYPVRGVPRWYTWSTNQETSASKNGIWHRFCFKRCRKRPGQKVRQFRNKNDKLQKSDQNGFTSREKQDFFEKNTSKFCSNSDILKENEKKIKKQLDNDPAIGHTLNRGRECFLRGPPDVAEKSLGTFEIDGRASEVTGQVSI